MFGYYIPPDDRYKAVPDEKGGVEWEVADKSKHAIKCPVCDGSGQVPSRIYDRPGETCSWGSYFQNNSWTYCRSCNGTGIFIVDEETDDKLARIEKQLEIFREEANSGKYNPEWVDSMEQTFEAVKCGDVEAAFKFLALALMKNG
jgi:hypothetical protein